MPSDADIARLAQRQHGNVATWQLRRLGFSKEAVRHRRRSGRLVQRYRGVHALGYMRMDLLSRASAAQLAAGHAAAVTGRSAACVFGALSDEGEPIHVVRPTRGEDRPGLVLHEGEPGKLWRRHDLPLTSPARTLLAIAETEDHQTLVRAYNELQVLRLLSAEGLTAALPDFTGRRGLAALKRLTGGEGTTRSVLEDLFLPLVRAANLPLPLLNAAVGDAVVDALWRQHKVIVELDGRRFHDTDSRFESDRRRDARLAAAGYVVLRFTHRRLTQEPYAVIAELSAALTQRAAA